MPTLTGSDSFTFTADDGESASLEAIVTITIQPANDGPAAASQAIVLGEDTPSPITLIGTDADGDTLIFTIDTPPANGGLGPVSPPTLPTPRTLTFMAPIPSPSSPMTGLKVPIRQQLDITIDPVNDSPTADNQTVSISEDAEIEIVLTATDIEDDALTYAIATPPANGTISGDPPAITYTPNTHFNGADGFTFVANDGTDDSEPALVSVNIVAINDAPMADDQSVTTPEDNPIDILLTGTDVDGDGLTYTLLAAPTNGTLSGTPPDVIYTPDMDYHGPDSFTFNVNDGSEDSPEATVSIDVTPVNDPPIAIAATVVTAEDTGVALTLTGSDSDDDDPLTFSISTPPSNGTLSGDAPDLTYTPNTDFNGPDSFTFLANDGVADPVEATVSIAVNPVNDAPTVDAQNLTTLEDTALEITLTGADIDSTGLTFVVDASPREWHP